MYCFRKSTNFHKKKEFVFAQHEIVMQTVIEINITMNKVVERWLFACPAPLHESIIIINPKLNAILFPPRQRKIISAIKANNLPKPFGRLWSIKLPPNKYSGASSEIFYQQNIIAKGHKTHAIAISTETRRI